MRRRAARLGAAAFALGLSLASPTAVAAADGAEADGAPPPANPTTSAAGTASPAAATRSGRAGGSRSGGPAAAARTADGAYPQRPGEPARASAGPGGEARGGGTARGAARPDAGRDTRVTAPDAGTPGARVARSTTPGVGAGVAAADTAAPDAPDTAAPDTTASDTTASDAETPAQTPAALAALTAQLAAPRAATAAATANADVFTVLFAPIQAFIEGIGLLVRRTFFNEAPTVNPVQITGFSSGPITGSIGAVDPEGDPIVYGLAREPSFGSVAIGADGSYSYTPGIGFGGTDTFAVTATDTGFHINLLNLFRPADTLATAVVTQGAAGPRLQFAFTYAGGALLWSNEARGALEAAGALLAANFDVAAPITVTYTVRGEFNPLSGTLASATSDLIGTGNGFLPTVVQNKIITGVDANGSAADGEIDWNFGLAWALGNSVAGGEYDFQSVAMHELMHTLGFLSNIDQAGSNTGRSWTAFDGFVVGADGTGAIGGDFRWDTAFNANLTGDNDGLYFDGPAAVAAYGGLVPLYTPDPWESGSSVSHLDDWTFVRPNEQLMNAFVEKGRGIRTLSPVEIGILTDLGYTMVPPPGSSAFLLIGLVLLRRRRTR